MVVLHVLRGPYEGQFLPLAAESIVIGRNPDSGIVLPLSNVSRMHARILKEAGKVYIQDLASRGGTYVNCRQAPTAPERQQLKHNDRIRICDFEAVILEHGPDVGEAPGPDVFEDHPPNHN